MADPINLHEFIDSHYGEDGDSELARRLDEIADIDAVHGVQKETALHVAVRRRRLSAAKILLQHGADINAKSGAGKTAYAHAARRKFDEIVTELEKQGADTSLNAADQFAVAIVNGNMDVAKQILENHPGVAKTGNAEEDRLLADVAGRNETEPVKFLIQAGADLTATALDDGTPLHQAAWFGQPANARLLIDAGAPLDHFDTCHNSSPLHWAVHGSRYSGASDERQEVYVQLVKMLLAAGSSLYYPDRPDSDDYKDRLLNDATDRIRPLIAAAIRTGE